MNFFKSVGRRVKAGIEGLRLKTVSFIQSAWDGEAYGIEDWYDASNLKSFKDSLYLFIGVSLIRDTVASIPLELYRIKSRDGEVEEIEDDPLLTLMQRPNDRQTQREFWKLAISYYLLAGEAFWYLERGKNPKAIPTAMANMKPDHVEIVMSEDKRTIVGYEFRKYDGSALKLRPDEVLHIKNIDPSNPLRGIGVVRPAAQRILTEREAAKYQADTFRNHGRPDVAVFTDVDLTSEAAEEARENWEEVYGGKKRSAGFFGNNVKSVQVLNATPKEMEGIESMKFLRDDIWASLRIPKAMMTSDEVNLANSKTARINYLSEAVLPVMDTFIDILNNRLITDMLEDKFFTYESPVKEDRELLLKEATELKKAAIITVNEARGLMNYPDVEDGDIREQAGAGSLFELSMKQKRLRRLAKGVMKKRPALIKKFRAIEAVAEMLEAEKRLKAVPRGRSSVFNTTKLKQRYVRTFNKNVDKKAATLKEVIDVYNDGLLKRILKYMEDFGVNATSFFDAAKELNTAKGMFIPTMKDLFIKTGQEALDSVADGFERTLAEQFTAPEQMLLALEARAEFFTISMLDTDYKELQKIIIEGMTAGDGVAEIGRSLRAYFENMSVARAKTIARTETGRLVSQATQEAYTQSEFITGKEWMTAGDSLVRDEHVVNDGMIVGTEAAFPNGEHYPGESTINCRCAIAPAV